jgi:hypothetical protein
MTHSEFLIDRIANCKRNLAKPNIRYENGRMSHDVEREVLAETQSELWDYQISNGRFYADGRLAGYDEEK